eukprot:12652216-Alexandrium_andersonii.AAC.1
MGTRSLFYHDCLDFMDRAAFDFELQPLRSLDTDAENMLKYEPVRRSDGQARLRPPEYLPSDKWPRFAPEQVIVLRRSNCRAIFPQLAK